MQSGQHPYRNKRTFHPKTEKEYIYYPVISTVSDGTTFLISLPRFQ